MTQALVRNSTLWANNPKQQLFYLAQKLWARKYAPGAILGVYTTDELEDAPAPKNMGAAEVVDNKATEGLSEEQVHAWRTTCEKGTAAATEYWKQATPDFRKRAAPSVREAMWAVATAADKKRTVDNETPAATPAAEPAAETRTAKQDADPETGETSPPPGAPAAGPTAAENADFLEGMERVEREGQQP